MKVIKYAIASLFIISTYGALATEEGEKKVEFEIGAGLLISPGYNDFVTELYEDALGYDTSGIGGWLDFYLGAKFNVTEQLSILGGADILLNAMDVSGGIIDETYLNTIIVPSVYVQYYFKETPSFYVNAGLSIPIPATGSSYLEFSNDGIGLGGNMGYAFGNTFGLELGYIYLPVEVEETFTGFGISEQYDFGGVLLKGKWSF